MPILALGVSYRRADVDLLERLAFAQEDEPKAYRRLADAPAVSEAVILSTCNRVEIYANVATYHAGFQALKRFLAESGEVAPEAFAEPLYAQYETDAAEHLFSVAAGIDSVVVGEPQILTQARRAFRRAEAEGAAGPLLSALFRGAIRTGRRARAETAIGAGPGLFVDAGLDLAEGSVGPLGGLRAAAVGAGSMASLAAQILRRRGIEHLRILNRSPERARRLADRTGAQARPLSALEDALGWADLVVSSTGASGVVIRRSAVEAAAARRAGRPLFVLDLAVPRDVEPSVRGLAGVELADLDAVGAELRHRGGSREAEIEAVRAIVAEEVERFESWRRASRLAPLLKGLKERGDQAVAAELARLGPRLASLSQREREAVEALARGVAAKLLHDPIVRVRERSTSGDAAARAAAELFGLRYPPAE